MTKKLGYRLPDDELYALKMYAVMKRKTLTDLVRDELAAIVEGAIELPVIEKESKTTVCSVEIPIQVADKLEELALEKKVTVGKLLQKTVLQMVDRAKEHTVPLRQAALNV